MDKLRIILPLLSLSPWNMHIDSYIAIVSLFGFNCKRTCCNVVRIYQNLKNCQNLTIIKKIPVKELSSIYGYIERKYKIDPLILIKIQINIFCKIWCRSSMFMKCYVHILFIVFFTADNNFNPHWKQIHLIRSIN